MITNSQMIKGENYKYEWSYVNSNCVMVIQTLKQIKQTNIVKQSPTQTHYVTFEIEKKLKIYNIIQ